MGNTNPPLPLPSGEDFKFPKRKPSLAQLAIRFLVKATLIMTIATTLLLLGWFLGREMEKQVRTDTRSELATRYSLLGKQKALLDLEADSARDTAATTIAEAVMLRAKQSVFEQRIATLEQQIKNQQRAAEDLEKSYIKRWEGTKAELEQTKGKFKAYRDAYKTHVREEARGEHLGTFTYRDYVFNDTVIERITPVGIEIRHESGAARLLFSLLPPKMRNRFAYDPGEAAGHLQAERASWLKRQVIADNARLEKRKKEDEMGRRIAMRIAEKEVDEILSKMASAERSLTFCESKLASPGRRSPKDYEWKIRQLRSDIVYYESQLENYGIFR